MELGTRHCREKSSCISRGFNGAVTDNHTQLLAKAIGGMARDDFLSVGDVIESLNSAVLSNPQRVMYELASMWYSLQTYDRGRVIEIIGSACSTASFSPIKHRVVPSISGYVWRDYELASNLIYSAISLHVLYSRSQESKTASVLRFAIKQYLRISGVKKPSELSFEANSKIRSELIYFLRFVCVSDVLDVSRAVRGTRAVLEERAAICLLLMDKDPEFASSHKLEAENIAQKLKFADGQLIVDSSRIYVDIQQLDFWASKNLAEEYSRYRDLVDLNIEKFKPIDDVISEIASNPVGNAIFVPENEADALLFNILVRIKDEFLVNPSFGLDFFLSQRVRHQSFIGSIRGPMEFANLITTRSDLLGPYKANEFWANKLVGVQSNHRPKIIEAFRTFSENFDSELIKAKDRYFQVKAKETPDGLIFLGLTTNMVELVKSMVPLDSTLDDFLGTVVALLWPGLEPSLAVTRSFITDELKPRLTDCADELRASVRGVAENTEDFLVFDAEIGRRSTEVQNKLDEAASWFKRGNADFTNKTFELREAVEMAQEFALACLPGFKPKLDVISIVSDAKIQATSLVLVHDLILIALQNAKDHSGLKAPSIRTSAFLDAAKGTLRVRIESDVKPSLRAMAKNGAEEKARLIAEGKSTFRSRREGGTGFFKLAAVVNQSRKGFLDFGLMDGGEFFIEVQYSFVIQSRPEGNE